MITSLVFKTLKNVMVGSNGKFVMHGEVYSTKDIPFVRYKFDTYTDTELDYIEKQIRNFEHSCHLVELGIENCQQVIETIQAREALANVIVYVYVDCTDEVVVNATFGETVGELLINIKSLVSTKIIECISIKDKTNSNPLNLITLEKLITQINGLSGMDKKHIAVCSSPLSFDGRACLTAEKARSLAATHSKSDTVALPTANHECMNCCGCIRYTAVDNDITEYVTNKQVKAKKDTDSNSDLRKEKSAKPAKKRGIASWNF